MIFRCRGLPAHLPVSLHPSSDVHLHNPSDAFFHAASMVQVTSGGASAINSWSPSSFRLQFPCLLRFTMAGAMRNCVANGVNEDATGDNVVAVPSREFSMVIIMSFNICVDRHRRFAETRIVASVTPQVSVIHQE